MMSRYHFMHRLSQWIGRRNLSRLQSQLKYWLTFRHDYSTDKPMKHPERQRKVFMIDGKTLHGGLSDRLRGLFSVYHYCKQKGIDFKVCWTYPFNLQDYLAPRYDWLITREQLSFNKRETKFTFFNSYSFMNNDEKNYFDLLHTDKPEHHVYSNVTLHEDLFQRYFNELFKPDKRLETAIQCCLDELGGYISLTFRFIGLLGDFNEDVARRLDGENEKRTYIEKCLSAIKTVYTKHPEVEKVLVTADSPIFLKEASKIPYVYVIPGTVVHMDCVEEDNYNVHLKIFLDFMLISKAQKCYSYHYGRMFAATKFARTAALIGGKELVTIGDD